MTDAVGKQGRGRRLATRLIPHITAGPISPTLLPHANEDLTDGEYTTIAAVACLQAFVPEFELPPQPFLVTVPHGEYFSVETNIDFTQVNRLYNARVPATHSSISAAYILSHVLNARLALDEAAQSNSELAADPVYAALAAHRVNAAVRSRSNSERSIGALQDLVFDNSLAIRDAINSGKKTMTDFLPILHKSEKFREWLRSKPIDADLIKEYYRCSTEDSWVAKLPAKSVRFLIFTALGIAVDGLGAGGVGTAAGVALGAGDTFLLDRILGGWRPNQFVEGSLAAFMPKASREP